MWVVPGASRKISALRKGLLSAIKSQSRSKSKRRLADIFDFAADSLVRKWLYTVPSQVARLSGTIGASTGSRFATVTPTKTGATASDDEGDDDDCSENGSDVEDSDGDQDQDQTTGGETDSSPVAMLHRKAQSSRKSSAYTKQPLKGRIARDSFFRPKICDLFSLPSKRTPFVGYAHESSPAPMAEVVPGLTHDDTLPDQTADDVHDSDCEDDYGQGGNLLEQRPEGSVVQQPPFGYGIRELFPLSNNHTPLTIIEFADEGEPRPSQTSSSLEYTTSRFNAIESTRLPDLTTTLEANTVDTSTAEEGYSVSSIAVVSSQTSSISPVVSTGAACHSFFFKLQDLFPLSTGRCSSSSVEPNMCYDQCFEQDHPKQVLPLEELEHCTDS